MMTRTLTRCLTLTLLLAPIMLVAPSADRYVLFELRPTEVRCNGYGDVTLPERRRWRADP